MSYGLDENKCFFINPKGEPHEGLLRFDEETLTRALESSIVHAKISPEAKITPYKKCEWFACKNDSTFCGYFEDLIEDSEADCGLFVKYENWWS